MHIKIGIDSCTPAEVNLVFDNERLALLSLDVDACSVARDDGVLGDRDFVLRLGLQHDAPCFKVLELAVGHIDCFSVD